MFQSGKMLFVLVLVSILAAGCSAGVSEDKPISEIKSEAEAMTVSSLDNMVSKYKSAIESKKSELESLKTKLQEIPAAQKIGEDAKKIKKEISTIANSLNSLKERLDVYVQALGEKQ